jgi:hypothetical protein
MIYMTLCKPFSHHYPKCQAIPADVRAQVESIKSAKKSHKSRGSAGSYWVTSCVRDLHMVDGWNGRGIFFAGNEHAGDHQVEGAEGPPQPDGGGSGKAGKGKDKGKQTKKKKKSPPKIQKALQTIFRKDSNSASGTSTALAHRC